MLGRHVSAVWVVWLLAVGSCSLVGQASGRAMKQTYADILHSFLHKPFLREKHPAMPEHLHQEQQQMWEALHRHKHQDLHMMMHQKQQQQAVAEAGTASQTAAGSIAASSNTSLASTDQDVLHSLHAKWPEGYVAVCAIVKDQSRDLRYWIEYHRWLGVSKFYILDNNSTLPAMLVLWDYIKQGLVDYQYFVGRPRRRPDFMDTNQYKAYHGCLLQHFKQHRWLAFIDIDEFFVFPPAGGAVASIAGSSGTEQGSAAQGTAEGSTPPTQQGLPAGTEAAAAAGAQGGANSAPGSESSSSSSSSSIGGRSKQNLAVFLSKYEQHAALGINWVLFGSSGLQQRPTAGPLASYTSCVPQQHWESTHVKVIANTGGVLGMGATPHEVVPRLGRSTVDVDGQPYKGPKTKKAKWHKLVIHHYVLKSRAEFANKKARGSGAGNVKDWSFFNYMDNLSNNTCTWGLPISRAFFASQPQLRPPRAEHICNTRSKQEQLRAGAAAAAEAGGEQQAAVGEAAAGGTVQQPADAGAAAGDDVNFDGVADGAAGSADADQG